MQETAGESDVSEEVITIYPDSKDRKNTAEIGRERVEGLPIPGNSVE